MRVARIQIDNILGIEHLDISPGTVTVLGGGNGVGKTSVLEAVKAAIGGGHDATLLRNGTEQGRVVLVMDDTTEITATVTEDKTDRAVKHPTYGKVGQVATYLKRLADALSLNPVAFLSAPPKKRAEYLLEALPLEVTDEMLRSCGLTALPPGAGLTRLDLAHKAAYDTRTGVNRLAKEAETTASKLSSSLPPAAAGGQDWSAVAAAAETERRDLEQGEVAEMGTMLEKASAYIRGIEADFNGRIRTLEMERDTAVKQAEGLRDSRRAEIKSARAARIAELTETITTARERAKADERAASLRETIAQSCQQAEAHTAEATRLTAQIEAIAALRQSLMSRLPIPGAEVRDGEVYLDGVPFDRVNRAKQVQFSLNLARLRAGELGLVIVDGLECLDAETFPAFEAAAAQSGLQFIVNRVTSGPLSIEHVG